MLDQPLNAILATYLPGGDALLTPVWHEWRDGGFNIITYAGKDIKYRNVKRDPRASITVFENGGLNRGIELRGSVQLDLGNANEICRRIAARYLGQENAETYMKAIEGVALAHIRLESGKLRAWDHADEEILPPPAR